MIEGLVNGKMAHLPKARDFAAKISIIYHHFHCYAMLKSKQLFLSIKRFKRSLNPLIDRNLLPSGFGKLRSSENDSKHQGESQHSSQMVPGTVPGKSSKTHS